MMNLLLLKGLTESTADEEKEEKEEKKEKEEKEEKGLVADISSDK